MLRPLMARAQNGAPKRLCVLYYPCGTVQSQFWPKAGSTDFASGPILGNFAKVKNDMVLLGGVWNSLDENWEGDAHSRGLISFMTGSRFAKLPGFGVADGAADSQHIVANARSIDQILLEKAAALKGTARPSIQLGGARSLAADAGLPGSRIMSYKGPGATGGLFAETRPGVALTNVFGDLMPGNTDSAALERMRLRRQGVLDFVAKDLGRLKAKVPASERSRLEEHLGAVTDLGRQVVTAGTAAGCARPTLAPLPSATEGAESKQHEAVSRQMLQIIKTAFQCDLTRVATFAFDNALTELPFDGVIPGFGNSDGHHSVTHFSDPRFHIGIDAFYCKLVADFVMDLKNTPDGAGASLLDNTLVVLFTDVNDGNGHGNEDLPVMLFGAKSMGLAGGRYAKFPGRFTTDVWLSIARAFGAELPAFGDPAFAKGPVTGLFA
ncbi:MAG: DUF1552 domain-containing protein [Deltaproteobacteria bacterium]|nr:DUF1552 domain-containing protein [Deltaproteobacteria bacterium]